MSCFCIAIGLFVEYGWSIKSTSIVQIFPEFAPMQVNTALCFILIGAALLFGLFERKKFAMVFMTLCGAVSGLTLIEHLSGFNFGIDTLLSDPFTTTETTSPGRMAPNTALCFVLSSVSLYLTFFVRSANYQIGGVIGTLVFGLGFTALVGYGVDNQSVYTWGKITAMALHTSFCFIVIGIALTVYSWRSMLVSNLTNINLRSILVGYIATIQVIFFLIDIQIPLGVAAGIFHVIILILAYFTQSLKVLNLFTLTSIILVLLGFYYSPNGSIMWMVITNRLLSILMIIVVFILLYVIIKKSRYQQYQNENLDKKILERTLELSKRNSELEQFAYISTHDLQEPIRTISSYSQLLNETNREGLDEIGIKSIDYIYSASKRMQELIKALLDYARLGKGLKLKSVSLSFLFETIKSDLNTLILENQAVLIIEKLPSINCYEKELTLLFQNIIINAIKYKKPTITPSIEISYTEEPLFHRISIKDNGVGIAVQFQDRIFHLFQRLHDHNEIEGTGIGLSQCRKIAELHDGSITVESTPGMGSTFHIRLSKKLIQN